MLQRVPTIMRLLLVKIFFLVLLGLSIQSCSIFGDNSIFGGSEPEDEYVDWTAKQFHTEAKEAMEKENYKKAIKLYEALESRYPFGEYAAQTQLDIAYAYFKNDEPEAALAATERFIKTHPRNPSVDYAYYLKGLINYNRGISFADRFLPTDTSKRDPGNSRKAYANFAELIQRFPESKYVPDAKKRMIALKNNMAMYEVHVARFYIRRKAYIAAASRASYVLEKYQRTPAVPYALLVLQEAYTELDLNELAGDAKRVYDLNYPDGPPVPEYAKTTFFHSVWDFFGFDR